MMSRKAVIDQDGFRHNVGIILSNTGGDVLWAKRIRQEAWQFPQGGIRQHETAEQALYRELFEEIGLESDDVKIVGRTKRWLRYRLPNKLVRHHDSPVCIGQKQIWYMLRLTAADSRVKLDTCSRPEFDRWQWVDYWRPLDEVVVFKRDVYRQALAELEPLLSAPC